MSTSRHLANLVDGHAAGPDGYVRLAIDADARHQSVRIVYFYRLKRAAVGSVLTDLITGLNLLAAKYDAFVVKHNALMAHLDTANVAGISNTNAATYPAVASGVNVAALVASFARS